MATTSVRKLSLAQKRELRDALRAVSHQAYIVETLVNADELDAANLANALDMLHSCVTRVAAIYTNVLLDGYLRPPSSIEK